MNIVDRIEIKDEKRDDSHHFMQYKFAKKQYESSLFYLNYTAISILKPYPLFFHLESHNV